MPTFTKITKVGAFTDDVANQINDNFAQLGTVMMAHGIDPHEQVKNPDPHAVPTRERTPLDPPEPPKPGEPGGPGHQPAHKPDTEPDDDDKSGKPSRGGHAGHK
jgi:hypothetical protein